MAQNQTNELQVLLPPGRIVNGDVYVGNEHDMNGAPLTWKSGKNAGQPRKQFFIAVAIPKGAEQHWNQTQWGAQLYNFGTQNLPQLSQRPDFAWKVTDGDSTIPMQNEKATRPCDNPNWKGHWIVKCTTNYAPGTYTIGANGQAQVLDQEGYIKRGYFAEVMITVQPNSNPQRPGIFVGHKAVCFRGFGPEIKSEGLNVAAIGFGQAAAPAGATQAPAAGFVPPASVTEVAPVTPQAGIVPNTGFVANAVAPAPAALAPLPTLAPAVPAVRLAPSVTMEQYNALRAAGHTDDALRAAGYIL